MNIIDREIEKFEKRFELIDCARLGCEGTKFFYDGIEEPKDLTCIKDFLRSSLQRVIDETKEKCIKALPERKDPLPYTLQDDPEQDRIFGFNEAIQQSKQNIKGINGI